MWGAEMWSDCGGPHKNNIRSSATAPQVAVRLRRDSMFLSRMQQFTLISS
jgi:hypothetical protein